MAALERAERARDGGARADHRSSGPAARVLRGRGHRDRLRAPRRRFRLDRARLRGRGRVRVGRDSLGILLGSELGAVGLVEFEEEEQEEEEVEGARQAAEQQLGRTGSGRAAEAPRERARPLCSARGEPPLRRTANGRALRRDPRPGRALARPLASGLDVGVVDHAHAQPDRPVGPALLPTPAPRPRGRPARPRRSWTG